MRTSTIVWIVVIIVILLGGWYLWMHSNVPAPVSPDMPTTTATTTSSDTVPAQTDNATQTTATTSSANSSDGTTVGENLILGINAATDNAPAYLSGYNGMTVYTYAPDQKSPGTSTCTGSCASNWPPYTVPSASDINVPASITGKVGTITRADGTIQVTYNGAPLYFYSGDAQPGDTYGQGVGGVWYVATP